MAEEKTNLKVLLTTEQISKRVRELARQISEDYRGKTLHAVCVLENGFIFMADLVRGVEVPVVCNFMKPEFTEVLLSIRDALPGALNVPEHEAVLVTGSGTSAMEMAVIGSVRAGRSLLVVDNGVYGDRLWKRLSLRPTPALSGMNACVRK